MTKAKGKVSVKRMLLNFTQDEEAIEARKKNTKRELDRLLRVTQGRKR